MKTTRLQVNALIAIVLLAGIAGALLWALTNADSCVQGEILGALIACVAGIAYAARQFADHIVNGV